MNNNIIIKSNFEELRKITESNKAIHKQLKEFEANVNNRRSVLLIPQELMDELINTKKVVKIHETVNSKNYYNKFYKIKEVNALLVEMKVRRDYFDTDIVYKVIPYMIKSLNEKTYSIIDYLEKVVIHYGEKRTEYSQDNKIKSLEKLILGIADYGYDCYNDDDFKCVLHHDIQKAILAVRGLALGDDSEQHRNYHTALGNYSRSTSLIVRNKNEFDKFKTILQIIYN